MIFIGHWGYSYPGYNQNTIRAFDKVAQAGVPAIEFDVQLCGDGQLVVVLFTRKVELTQLIMREESDRLG